MRIYTFLDSQDNIIEQVRADNYSQAMARLSAIAKTLLIDNFYSEVA